MHPVLLNVPPSFFELIPVLSKLETTPLLLHDLETSVYESMKNPGLHGYISYTILMYQLLINLAILKLHPLSQHGYLVHHNDHIHDHTYN